MQRYEKDINNGKINEIKEEREIDYDQRYFSMSEKELGNISFKQWS